jgi:hypothetical protein
LVATGFAVLAGGITAWSVRPAVWWIGAIAAALAALAFLVGSGPAHRPRVATDAGRVDLVRRYQDRFVRRVAVTFVDLLALLPAARPVPLPTILASRPIVARFVLVGVLSRRRSAMLGLSVGLVAVVLHVVLPLLSPMWLVGLGAYLAALPFAASTAALFQRPGLRRWLGGSDWELRWTTGVVLLPVTIAWLGLVAAFGLPFTATTAAIALLAAGAVVRTATRPPIDFANIGVTVTPDGNLVPFGLIMQLIRGPELLVIGLLVAGSTLPLAAVLAVLALLSAFAVAR